MFLFSKMHITFLVAKFLGNIFPTGEHQCRKVDRILCKTIHQIDQTKANLRGSNICRKISPNQISLKLVYLFVLWFYMYICMDTLVDGWGGRRTYRRTVEFE
jgi:hypothetical protein